MSVVDLHPEELLDKDARGDLTSEERVRLDAHLARCSACRAEQLLRADFAAELDEDDRDSAILGLVQGVLAAPPAAAPQPAPAPLHEMAETAVATKKAANDDVMPELAAVPGLRRRPRRTAVVLLVAAAVLAASAAGATGLTGRVWQHIRGGSLETTHTSATSLPTAPASPSAPVGPRASLPVAVEAVEPIAVPTVPETTPADTVESVPVLPAPVALAAPVAPAPFVAPVARVAPVITNATNANPSAPPVVAPAAPTTAAALFESANTARRMGDAATALSRYDALDRQFPGTQEARLAKATTAKLLLDRGDAAGALSRFDAYLASGSPELREEAMAGRATALERLGRGDDEARAWAALLATYPRTPYAAHANARAARRSLAQ